MAFAELDTSSGVPLYRQIKEILREEILSGGSDTTMAITESQLIERFDVSRAPIRQALQELTNEGYVYRRQGKGTFPVAGARVDRPSDVRPGNLIRYLQERGMRPSSTVSGIGRIPATAEVSARLGVDEGHSLLHFTRLIRVDGHAFAEAEVYVRAPRDFTPTNVELDEAGSVFDLLERRYGMAVVRTEHEAWAAAATTGQADRLGIAEGTPLLVIDTRFCAAGGAPIGWRSAVHTPGEFKFHFVQEV